MIKTQVIKEHNKPIAVVLDYKQYQQLLDDAQDRRDYHSAIRTKNENKKWVSHTRLKKALGL